MKEIIKRTSKMPNLPEPFEMRNWRKVAEDYTRLIFDFNAEGDFLPLPWLDRSHVNCDKDMVGIPSYINSKRDRVDGKQEGINLMSAVLGATLSGVDMSNDRGINHVDMLEGYFNSANGQNLFLNTASCPTGGSFWYETYPNLLMSALSNLYSCEWLDKHIRNIAEKYLTAIEAMNGDFSHTAFDFKTMKPYDNGRWTEPEGAAGYAFVLYNEYKRSGEGKFLKGACRAMDFLDNYQGNPYYELLLPYACYVGARLNAEENCSYNLERLVNQCFDGDSTVRQGWGVVAERWGDCDCHGLCGSLTDWGQRWDMRKDNAAGDIDPIKSGYAFAGNTFSMAAGLIAMVRYDTSFAHDIGKWFLNAANSARLFYPGAHSPRSQSCAFFRDDPDNCIAYEGLRKYWDSVSPYATGDPIRYSWGAIDIGLYGSSHVGIFGGVFGTTDDERILKLNLRATDLILGEGYESYLVYNPYSEEKCVHLEGLSGTVLWDAVTCRELGKINNGCAEISISGDTALVAVCLPEGEVRESEGQITLNGVTIKY